MLRPLEHQPDASQRDLARQTRVSLGAVNYCLPALRAKPRGEPDRTTVFEFAGHQIDFAAWTIHLANGQLETLGEREAMILKLFVENPNRVVSRNEILDRIWGENNYPSSRTVDNFIVRLRRILEPDPSAPKYLHTVWGVGYRFTPEG